MAKMLLLLSIGSLTAHHGVAGISDNVNAIQLHITEDSPSAMHPKCGTCNVENKCYQVESSQFRALGCYSAQNKNSCEMDGGEWCGLQYGERNGNEDDCPHGQFRNKGLCPCLQDCCCHKCGNPFNAYDNEDKTCEPQTVSCGAPTDRGGTNGFGTGCYGTKTLNTGYADFSDTTTRCHCSSGKVVVVPKAPTPTPRPAPATKPTASPTNKDTLKSGSVLKSGDKLTSQNGKHRFVMQADGNAVVYGPSGRKFSTGPMGVGAEIELQTDGNMAVNRGGEYAGWNAGTVGLGADSLVIQDDGNMVMYTADRRAIWASSSNNNAGGMVDTLKSGSTLKSGDKLTSLNGNYRFVMQGDGNAVLYGPSGPKFKTGSKGEGAEIKLQTDGNMVVNKGGNYAGWNAGTRGTGADSLVLHDDGTMVMYTADGRAIWKSSSNKNAGGKV